MRMEADWDLHAVVRACIYPSAATPSKNTSELESELAAPSSGLPLGDLPSSEDSPTATISNGIGDLHELFRPFLKNASPKEQQPHKQPLGSPPTKMSNSHTPRSKRRKNQMKKVCNVPAEALASDVWAWRKYGQKPIKGSPYPRGYYRCSSSKGCLARKQVERNRSDPKMFIVTYTAEHNHPAPTHRNSLAGSTRQKTLTPNDKGPSKASCSSPASSQDDDAQHSNNSGSPEDKEDDDVEDEESFRMTSEDAMSDDFFAGLEEFTAASPNVITDFPWYANTGPSPNPQV